MSTLNLKYQRNSTKTYDTISFSFFFFLLEACLLLEQTGCSSWMAPFHLEKDSLTGFKQTAFLMAWNFLLFPSSTSFTSLFTSVLQGAPAVSNITMKKRTLFSWSFDYVLRNAEERETLQSFKTLCYVDCFCSEYTFREKEGGKETKSMLPKS